MVVHVGSFSLSFFSLLTVPLCSERHYEAIATIGTSDQSLQLAEACKPLHGLLSLCLNADPCNSCRGGLHPSLCAHKAKHNGATICMFDMRSGLDNVMRYSTHHRSLYPAMACARGHFLFTSHVGTPLTVWDKR